MQKNNKDKIKVLEVNNIDLFGGQFNGFELIKYLNSTSEIEAKQIVNEKISDEENVVLLYDNNAKNMKRYESKISSNENKILSVKAVISISSDQLIKSKEYNEADIIHFHMFHNSKLSLYSLLKIAREKKVIFSFHDPWFLTGRCVHFYDCDKWKTGCENCPNLNNLFKLSKDNCDVLWKLKKYIFDNINADIIVPCVWMENLVKDSDIMSNQKNIHNIPLGVDTKYYVDNSKKDILRKKYGISKDEIVIFFRAQMEFKGTEYIEEALKLLNTDKKVTIITCSEVGLLSSIKSKYNIIDLGKIKNDKLLEAYNMCDMFLMPSKAESFGLMAVEAMSCERPVIVFNNSALPFVTHAPECGIAVDNRNSKELSKAIKHLIDSKEERINRGKLGRKIVLENYDITSYNEKICNLYKTIYLRKNDTKECKVYKNNSDKEINCLKYMLYNLTLNVFGNIPVVFEDYVSKTKVENIKIDYTNYYIMEFIEKYNKELNNYVNTISHIKPNKIVKKIKKALYLLKNDPEKLISILNGNK